MASSAEPLRRPQAQPNVPDKLGELLVRTGKINQTQLNEALALQKDQGGRVGTNLVKLGYMTEKQLVDSLSQHFKVPSVDLNGLDIDDAVLKIIPADLARKYTILPVSKAGATITVAMIDPTNVFAMDDVKFMTGYRVEPVVASETAIRVAIDRYYGSTHAIELKKVMEDLSEESATGSDLEVLEEEEDLDLATLEEESEQAPVVKLVNLILTDAIKRGASDIHIEPYEKEYRVRYRIDGILYEMMHPPLKLKEAITSRIKIMAKLDIAEKRLPQDGRIKIKTKISGKSKDLDYRVSVLPTLFGEKIVMRLLDKDKLMLDMTKLGFEAESLRKFEAGDPQALRHGAGHRPHRLGQDQHALLGPAAHQHAGGQHHDRRGSGRVQPLGHQPGADARADRPELRRRAALLPAPGPEHHPGGRDPRLRDRRGGDQGRHDRPPRALDPAHQRRAVVDQPPDEHGHRALPGGHLGAPDRRPAAGAPHLHLLQGAARGAARGARAGRLLRARVAHAQALPGRGCERCSNTGYKGRVGLYEVLEIEDELREMILSGGSAFELRQKAVQLGMMTLRGSGLQKIRDGMTTLEEVVRETVD